MGGTIQPDATRQATDYKNRLQRNKDSASLMKELAIRNAHTVDEDCLQCTEKNLVNSQTAIWQHASLSNVIKMLKILKPRINDSIRQLAYNFEKLE